MEHSADHDLLIEIKTKMSSVIDEMRLMRDDTKEKMKGLEVNKADLKDFVEFKANVNADNIRRDAETKSMWTETKAAFATSINTLDTSIGTLKADTTALLIRNSYIWGGIAVLAFIAPYIINFIFKIK